MSCQSRHVASTSPQVPDTLGTEVQVRTRESRITKPLGLRFRATLGEEAEVELALAWDPRAPLAATRRR